MNATVKKALEVDQAIQSVLKIVATQSETDADYIRALLITKKIFESSVDTIIQEIQHQQDIKKDIN
jgi:hypothetical protein